MEQPKITDFINGKVIYDNEDQRFWIKDKSEGIRPLAELRGWGSIQVLFRKPDGFTDTKGAAKFQDEVGQLIADAINEKITKSQEIVHVPFHRR